MRSGLALAQLAGILSDVEYLELLEAFRLYVRAGGTAAEVAEMLEQALPLFLGDVGVH